MKIKSCSEDFIVREIANLPLVKQGGYAVYRLQKTNCNTVEVLHRLAKQFHLPIEAFSYGGRKDRHSIATQHIAVKSADILKPSEKDFSLVFLGFMARPMGPDLIQANDFEVVVRSITQAQSQTFKNILETVKESGFPNYFDDQRFGSYDSLQGFFAEKVLKNQFNGACKIYLTRLNEEDKKEDRVRKDLFFKNWKDWELCFKNAKTKKEMEAFSYLRRNPNGFLDLLRKIPREEIRMYFSAYQAFLWNSMLRKILGLQCSGAFLKYGGEAGDYIFPRSFSKKNIDTFKNGALAVPGTRAQCSGEIFQRSYDVVLKENGLRPGMFNRQKLRQAYIKSFNRPVLAWPQNLEFQVNPDEVYEGKLKITLKFRLGRGCYATMLVKRLYAC